jgi:hypothetical protein
MMSSRNVNPAHPPRRGCSRPGAWLLAVCLLASAQASAQDNKAAAESLFQTGKQLMEQQRFTEACPKFVESQRLDPSVGTMLNLARCHEHTGKTASAWAEYKEAAILARTAGQTDRETAANELADKLEPSLSKLQIDPPKGIPNLVVRRDGVVMGPAALGTSIAVDPGEHLIEASAQGYAPWSVKVKISHERDRQTVRIPLLDKRPESASGERRPSALRTAGFVAGGVGIAALGAGAALGILAAGDASDAENDQSLCPQKQCTPAGEKTIEAAKTKALVSTIAIPVGGAAIGAGVVMFIVSRASKPAAGTARASLPQITPAIGPGGCGVWLSGAF